MEREPLTRNEIRKIIKLTFLPELFRLDISIFQGEKHDASPDQKSE